jgi:hypothetical protein
MDNNSKTIIIFLILILIICIIVTYILINDFNISNMFIDKVYRSWTSAGDDPNISHMTPSLKISNQNISQLGSYQVPETGTDKYSGVTKQIPTGMSSFTGNFNNYGSFQNPSLNTERMKNKIKKENYINKGGYISENLELEKFTPADYSNYDPIDNGGVDLLTLDSHRNFAAQVVAKHNLVRESDVEFEETPYIVVNANALWRPQIHN